MRIAFVNTGRFRNSHRSYFSDPVQLVAMHHICKQAGHDSQIFPLGYPDQEQSIQRLQEFCPDILALSFLDPSVDDLERTEFLLQHFREKGLHLLLGGPDTTLQTNTYINGFAPISSTEWRSVILVKGAGELLLSTLSAHKFDLTLPEVQEKLKKENIDFSFEKDLFIVQNLKKIPLDQQGYERDYDPSPFHGSFAVKWATGCWATCRFCFNVPQRSDYRSPELACREALHLIELGATLIQIASPQFTAHPNKASAIIEKLPLEQVKVAFAARVDSFYHAMTRNREVWLKFANSNVHQVDIGLDSFLPERLVRIGKHNKLQQAEAQSHHLEEILSFFAGKKAKVALYLMPLDWQMELKEARQEMQILLDYLDRYPFCLLVEADNIINLLSYSTGSFFSKTMAPQDYYFFEKDPRLFLLLNMITWFYQEMLGAVQETNEPSKLADEAFSRVMAKFFLRSVDLLITFPSDVISAKRNLHIRKKTRSGDECLERLLVELPSKLEEKARTFLQREGEKKKQTLEEEIEQLLIKKVHARKNLKDI